MTRASSIRLAPDVKITVAPDARAQGRERLRTTTQGEETDSTRPAEVCKRETARCRPSNFAQGVLDLFQPETTKEFALPTRRRQQHVIRGHLRPPCGAQTARRRKHGRKQRRIGFERPLR